MLANANIWDLAAMLNLFDNIQPNAAATRQQSLATEIKRPGIGSILSSTIRDR
jgi:hypothetical protein